MIKGGSVSHENGFILMKVTVFQTEVFMLKKCLFILTLGCAGGFGTISRYGLSHLLTTFAGPRYPWGTLVVNVVGCFLFGIFAELFTTEKLDAGWKVIVLTGFLGGFTTFSAFAFELESLRGQGLHQMALLHFLGNNLLGLAAIIAGFYVARSWF